MRRMRRQRRAAGCRCRGACNADSRQTTPCGTAAAATARPWCSVIGRSAKAHTRRARRVRVGPRPASRVSICRWIPASARSPGVTPRARRASLSVRSRWVAPGMWQMLDSYQQLSRFCHTPSLHVSPRITTYHRRHSLRRPAWQSPIPANTPIDTALRARALRVTPGGMTGHLNAAYLPPGYPQFFQRARGLPAVGRGWPRVHRLHVQLGAQPAGPPPPRGGSRRRAAACAGRLPQRAHAALGGAGRGAGGAHRARRLGDVSEERHRCHHRVRDRGARGHRQTQDPAGEQGVPRLGPVVHALTGRRDRRRPRAPDRVHLQRHRQPRCRRQRRGQRPRRRAGERVQARHRRRPRAAHTGLCAARARALRCARRRAHPRRGARRLPPARRRQLGAAGRAARPERVEQGHRQRPRAGRRGRHRCAARRGHAHLFDRLVLGRRRGDGRRAGHAHRGRPRRRPDRAPAAHGQPPAARHNRTSRRARREAAPERAGADAADPVRRRPAVRERHRVLRGAAAARGVPASAAQHVLCGGGGRLEVDQQIVPRCLLYRQFSSAWHL